ncbi:MAG: hypothetical protein ACR2O6_09255, partial [Ilumatobacteraceae bacterium]
VWSVGDHGGMTIVEVHNDSPRAFAVAFSGRGLLTDRPVSDVPPQGIDLPDDAIVLPVGHRTSVRVGFAAGESDRATGALPPVADPAAVVRGWTAVTGRAGRFELPDERLVHEVTAARSDLLLDGPVDPATDPAGFVFDVAQLARLGEPAAEWLPDVVGPIESIARNDSADAAAALSAAAGLVAAAGDSLATADLGRLLGRRGDDPAAPRAGFAELERGDSAGRFAHDVEALLVAGGVLLARGFATPWLGAELAVHGLPTAPRSTVSFAVRWHGARPAVLWEQHGPPVTLTAPAVDPQWSSGAPSGEALWAEPPKRTPLRLTPES